MSAISVKNLSKNYIVHRKEEGLTGSLKSVFSRKNETVKAVQDITFDIKQGELVGFIGPNGAGKTTTLKVLSGLLHPTKGEVSVTGFKPFERKNEFLKKISLVMGQKNQLWWDLPAVETFRLNKEIYAIPDKQYQETLDTLTDILDLKDYIHIQVRKLSLGQRMKAELIASLLHAPDVLFLDEPTIGLDVVMQKTVRDFIGEYNKKYNATIILTSHYMLDVQELAKRVIVIDHGQLLFDGPLTDIIKKYAGEKRIIVELEGTIPERELAKVASLEEARGNHAIFKVKREEVPSTTEAVLKKLPVLDLTVEDLSIEDIIRNLFTSNRVTKMQSDKDAK